MLDLRLVGPFQCEPALENVVRIVYEGRNISIELRDLISEVAKKTIYVKQIDDFPFGAKYDDVSSSIFIHKSLGDNLINPHHREAKKVHALIMELCNAVYYKKHLFAALGKMKFGLDGYVRKVEKGEYKLLIKTDRIFKEIVNCYLGFADYSYAKPLKDFRRHYLGQQLCGHSAFVAKLSLYRGEYIGTWKCPIQTEQERKFLRFVISYFSKHGETEELLNRIEAIKDNEALYENAMHFIKDVEACPKPSVETPLYSDAIGALQLRVQGLLSYVQTRLSECTLFQGSWQTLSRLDLSQSSPGV
jgi:hypothetical protein